MGKGRYIILIGNYGSGKTEIALNIAIRAARAASARRSSTSTRSTTISACPTASSCWSRTR